jgi:hypothetical protein
MVDDGRQPTSQGGTVKYVVISKLNTGTDNAKAALAVFSKTGTAPGTEALLAGADAKTFVSIIEADTLDTANAATYAPFFESVTVIPTVPVDEAWMIALQSAVAAWG